jgi:hypothetical protein
MSAIRQAFQYLLIHNIPMESKQFIRPNFNPGRLAPCFCESGRRFKDCCGKLSKDRALPHGVGKISGLLSSEQCRAWVEYFESMPREAVDVFTLKKGEDKGVSLGKSSLRVTDRVWIDDRKEELDQLICGALTGMIAEQVNRRFSWFELPKVYRYEPGGYYKTHADSELPVDEGHWVKKFDRDISILLYLNDDFEGGGLRFESFNYVYQPKAGDLLFFPSDHRYLHEAMPTQSGIRYAVVTWAAFEDEPRAQDEPFETNVPIS